MVNMMFDCDHAGKATVSSLVGIALSCVGSFFLTACATPHLTQISSDTYLIKMTDTRGAFGDFGQARDDTIKQARDFAFSQNKVLVPLNVVETPMRGRQFYSIEYTFRLDEPQYINLGAQ